MKKTRPRNRKRVREMKKADLVPSDQLPESIRDFGVDLVPDLVPSADLVPDLVPSACWVALTLGPGREEAAVG